MKVAFFHGLESAPYTEKNDELRAKFNYVYDPPMDYKDPTLFEKTLKTIKSRNIDLLIGSSMGGWFAYCLSTVTGIPCLVFNPAVHGRTFDPTVQRGNIPAKHTVVLGVDDDVVDPHKVIDWFAKNGVGYQTYNWEKMEHRIPIAIFKKWITSPRIA